MKTGPIKKVWTWTSTNPGKAVAVVGSVYVISALLGRAAGALTAALATAYVSGTGKGCSR